MFLLVRAGKPRANQGTPPPHSPHPLHPVKANCFDVHGWPAEICLQELILSYLIRVGGFELWRLRVGLGFEVLSPGGPEFD